MGVQHIAQHRIYQMLAGYQLQIAAGAVEGAFQTLPMDVYEVGVGELVRAGALLGDPWLVVAG